MKTLTYTVLAASLGMLAVPHCWGQTMDNSQERLLRLEALDLFNNMRNLGPMNQGVRQFAELFADKLVVSGDTTSHFAVMPNDFPPLCGQTQTVSRTSFGEAMDVFDYAAYFEENTRNLIPGYRLLELGDIDYGSNTIEVTFEKTLLDKNAKCGSNAFPAGVKSTQIGVVTFRLNGDRLDRKSVKFLEIKDAGSQEQLTTHYVLRSSPGSNEYFPSTNDVLKFNQGQSQEVIDVDAMGVFEPGEVSLKDFNPRNFWEFLSDEQPKDSKIGGDLAECDCGGEPWFLTSKENLVQLDMLVGTVSVVPSFDRSDIQIANAETAPIQIGARWTKYLVGANLGKNNLRPFYGAQGSFQQDSWSLDASQFNTEAETVDPDGDPYLRQITVSDFEEHIESNLLHLGLSGGLAREVFLSASKRFIWQGEVGVHYGLLTSSTYNATAEGYFRGLYDVYYGIVIDDLGIYDFGTHSMTTTSNTPLSQHGAGFHLGTGLMHRPTGSGLGVGLSLNYARTSWRNSTSSSEITSTPSELLSTMHLASGIARNAFTFSPSIFLLF